MRPIDADELTEMVWRERLDTRERIADLIARQPTIEKGAKRGKWTDLNNGAIYHYECSCCKGHTGWHEKFCPNCGADMRGTET